MRSSSSNPSRFTLHEHVLIGRYLTAERPGILFRRLPDTSVQDGGAVVRQKPHQHPAQAAVRIEPDADDGLPRRPLQSGEAQLSANFYACASTSAQRPASSDSASGCRHERLTPIHLGEERVQRCLLALLRRLSQERAIDSATSSCIPIRCGGCGAANINTTNSSLPTSSRPRRQVFLRCFEVLQYCNTRVPS
jgi:hypothetical protein